MSKKKKAKEAEAEQQSDREDAAEHERFVQTNARLNAVFREVRDREPELETVDRAEELPMDACAWEETLDDADADAASIPDLGDSISRIRARLRERIQTGTNPFQSL